VPCPKCGRPFASDGKGNLKCAGCGYVEPVPPLKRRPQGRRPPGKRL